MFRDTEAELERIQEALLREEDSPLPEAEIQEDPETFQNYANDYGRKKSSSAGLWVLLLVLLTGILLVAVYWAVEILGVLPWKW